MDLEDWFITHSLEVQTPLKSICWSLESQISDLEK